jgi:phage terminase small subunit
MKKKTTITWTEFTPQQVEFLKNYLDPQSETWSSITQSAIKAGYSEEYANNLSAMNWFKEGVEDTRLLDKAKKNLWQFVADDNEKNYQWDATKFILTTIGKNKFTPRTEVVLPDGESLNKSKQAINEILSRGNTGGK